MVQHVRGRVRRRLQFYEFERRGSKPEITFKLNFPASEALYDDLVMSVDGQPLPMITTKDGAYGNSLVTAGKTAKLHTAYRSQGLDAWRYDFGEGVSQIRNFTLNMHTDFKGVDFPENTISPTTKTETANGWDLTWSYKNMVSGYQIGMAMPEKLQPGPLAGQISFFAPVSLFFFFFLIFIITTLRGIDLHPMNYFFFAAAFFAFHLLLAYLVDHISIHVAFIICSQLVSVFSGGQLSAALRGRAAIRRRGGWSGAADLSYFVFVCIFLSGIHWPRRHNRLDPDAFCGDANDGPDQLAGEVCEERRVAIISGGAGGRLRRGLRLRRRTR